MVQIAEQVPSFAGFWFTKDDDMVVAMTDTTAFPSARTLVQARLGAHKPKRYTVKAVEFSFRELATFRAALRQHVFAIDGVVTLSIKESANRIKVGATSLAAERDIRSLLAALALPQDAVIVERVDPVLLQRRTREPAGGAFTTTLAHQQPDTLVEGGWIIRPGGGNCTIGFPALRSNGDPVMITASHCSSTAFSLDYSAVRFFSTSGPLIGYEIADPVASFCSIDPWYACRDSDAAMFSADSAAINLGKIARTTFAEGDEGEDGSIIIDSSNPTFSIVSRADHVYENEVLHQMGHVSGWTYGFVEDTCVDLYAEAYETVIDCADRVDYESDGGDSGAPVFYIISGGSVELRGIHIGRQAWPWWDGIMSSLYEIEADLEPLIVIDTPVSALASGPVSVPPNASCDWYGEATPGWPPYTYEWRRNGVLVGTSADYSTSSTGAGAFTLQFKVTDSRSDQDSKWFNVEIDSMRLGEFIC